MEEEESLEESRNLSKANSNWRDKFAEAPSSFDDLIYDKREEVCSHEEEAETEDDALEGLDQIEDEIEVVDDEHESEVNVAEEINETASDLPLDSIGFLCDASIEEPSTSYTTSSPIKVFTYENQNTSLEENEEEVYNDEYWLPDSHEVFANVTNGDITDVADTVLNEVNINNDSRRARGRGRVRGYRGGRPGRGHKAAASLKPHNWTRGDHLIEVCVDDEDVPPILKAMFLEVVRNREAKAREARQRDLAKQAREKKTRREMNYDNDRDREEEFFDADDGGYAELLRNDNSFEWSPMASFRGKPEVFKPKKTGAMKKYIKPYDAFRSYWDDRILEHIVTETNRYACHIGSISKNFKSAWYPTNIHEIMILFSFWMMLGIIRMPTIKSCFSLDPLLKTEIFRVMFTMGRYNALIRALHFVDNTVRPQNASRTYCFGPIMDHLNAKFQSNYIPSENIAIDESLTLWKGKLSFRQYIKTKAAKLGLKTFEICESSTGYLWSFFLYTGKGTIDESESESPLLKSPAVVLKLIKPLLNKGYKLFMDNWFNSPPLARFLKRNGTDCIGTLRPCLRTVPPLVSLADLRQGQYVARHSGDVCVMAYRDKKTVYTISTCHGAESGPVPAKPNQTPQWKPQVILDYNRYMGGIDRKDQMLEPYLLERKRCNKWYMKLFKRLLNVSILNSRILMESSCGSRTDHLSFRIQLVDSILEHHLQLCPRSRLPSSKGRSKLLTPHRLLPEPHWPVRVERTAADEAKNWSTRVRCNVCIRLGSKNKKTIYKCETCDVPLCIDNCFRYFHEEL